MTRQQQISQAMKPRQIKMSPEQVFKAISVLTDSLSTRELTDLQKQIDLILKTRTNETATETN